MKTHFQTFLVLVLLFSSSIGFAQTELVIHINHKLNGYDFEVNEPGMTPDSAVFTLSRVQYYISEVIIEHDGGQVTEITDTWFLVDATEATELNLGMQSIDAVEKIRFSVGVDSAHNHLDPSSYPVSHPLAHQSPVMHWGWVTGYFFAVVEGLDIQKNVFQIYAMGDQNYFQTEVEVNSEMVNGKNQVTIYGNYSKNFEDIEIENGNITHDETGDARTFLINFSEYVFSAIEPTDSFRVETDTPNGVMETNLESSISVFPNPSKDGQFMFAVASSSDQTRNAVLMDITGKQVNEIRSIQPQRNYAFTNLEAGLYLLMIRDNQGTATAVKKVLVH